MVQNVKNAEIVLTAPGVVGRKVANTLGNQLLYITIEPEKLIPKHTVENDATFIVLNGTGELILDDEKFQIAKGDFVDIKKEQNREWRNTGNVDLEILTVKK